MSFVKFLVYFVVSEASRSYGPRRQTFSDRLQVLIDVLAADVMRLPSVPNHCKIIQCKNTFQQFASNHRLISMKYFLCIAIVLLLTVGYLQAEDVLAVIVLKGHTGGHVTAAAFSPDGKKVVTASTDDTAQIWNVEQSTVPSRPTITDF